MKGWWSELPKVAWLDLSTRSPLYMISALEPVALVILLDQPGVQPWAGGALLIVTLAHTAGCLAVLRSGLEHRIDGRALPRTLLVGTAGLTIVGLAVGPLAFSDYGRLLGSDGFPVGLAVSVLFCGSFTAALTPVLTRRQVLLAVGVPALLAGVLQLLIAAEIPQAPWTLNYLLVVGVLALVYRSSTWLLGLIWEIDRARGVEARLAVAEERLRLTRDLHDVLGRNLTLIAVTSELAAGLVHRDRADAVQRMMHVRQLAQDSMRDVREVVGGRRAADLEAELAGARSVLRSAGIETVVTAAGGRLPPAEQSAFGWVVREATTNILRHTTADRVTIDLDVLPDLTGTAEARLRIDNNGAPAAAHACVIDGHGHGLDGLRQRLGGLGGRLTAGPRPTGGFRVEARLPLSGEEPRQ